MEKRLPTGPKAEAESIDEYLARLQVDARDAVKTIVAARLARGDGIPNRDDDTASLLQDVADHVIASCDVLTHDEWMTLVRELGGYFAGDWNDQ